MKAEDKRRELITLARCLPYLCLKENGRLSYGDTDWFDTTANLFYGHLFYGDWYIGGSSPFYSIAVMKNGWRGRSLCLNDNDRPRLHWQKIEDLLRDTANFWLATSDAVEKLEVTARHQLIMHVKQRQLRLALRDARMLLGAKAWRTPRWRDLVRRSVPDETEAYKIGRARNFRKTLLIPVRRSIWRPKSLLVNLRTIWWAILITWYISAFSRVTRQGPAPINMCAPR